MNKLSNEITFLGSLLNVSDYKIKRTPSRIRIRTTLMDGISLLHHLFVSITKRLSGKRYKEIE